ncbi:MAG: hypothetical protein RQ763_03430 [Sulfurimonas sp.]|uniref:hypothetical protein n=1 Tax=Sulfurimonas sp. TaxID=2022749 RepID=UPI0028CEF965|nr:hypothetical protein [Sulfurimonas sp.]MDT8338232.1 hypothetical protein [Sulfurimonas sp.]
MSEDLDKLKKIGVQKIHERTHISRTHIESIFNENFEGMGSVQLLGFLSIFEREYDIDLSELKNRAREYFKSQKSDEENAKKKVKIFTASKRKRKWTFFYILIGAAVVFTLFYFASRMPQNEIIDPSRNFQAAVPTLQDDKNDSVLDENLSQDSLMESTGVEEIVRVEEKPKEKLEEKQPEPEVKPLSFKIIPKTKVWLGYIDLSDYKKYQTTFSDELELDPAKEWLLSFGHGYIKIEINGETTEFKDPNTMRFSYIDSELKQISYDEFTRLNRGNEW